MRSASIAPIAMSIALLAAAAAPASVTVVRDDQDRITRVAIDAGFNPQGGGSYTIDALPGQDVRSGPARLLWEMQVPIPFGGGVVRAEGVPIATSVPLARDPATGVAIAPAPGASAPSADAFAAVSLPSPTDYRFLTIICSSIVFGDPSLAVRCGAAWLAAAHGDGIPIEPPNAPSAYRDVPDERSERDEALLGCGPAYATSCDADGIDLRLADASALHQWFPDLAGPLPDGSDSDVVQRFAWNWYAAHLMLGGVEPGLDVAAACTFETPAGCAALGLPEGRFAAHRVLPDEPIAGPEVRWAWEHGTTFALGPLEIEGDVDPLLVSYLLASGVQRTYVSGPFEGANGEPDAAVTWVPEPPGPAAALTAIAVLFGIRRPRPR